MVLRKLRMFGFKSFADKVNIEFGEGITAVVGPNGCGKSNVVDAIRWVFGEQKASALRSTSMQDVIFSGTLQRQALNMAEVTIVIENNRGVLPIEYSEVAVTRRLYRSGESEYRLNKVPCRLRDIQGLFVDTGIGSNAYTTIENHMIDSILSDKAEERRILFEEAAGIGKYKRRRKESLRKLEYTRQDLFRINDKVQAKAHDVRVLARQVGKAKKYRTWHDELKRLEVGYEKRHFCELDEAMKQRGAGVEEIETSLETLKAGISTAESDLQKRNLDMVKKEEALQEAGGRVARAQEKIVGVDKEISLSEETRKHLLENIDRLDQEARYREEEIRCKQELRLKIEEGLVEAQSQLDRHREMLVKVQDELAAFDQDLQTRRSDADRISQERLDHSNAVGDQKNSIAGLQHALRSALESHDRDERELARLEVQHTECREHVDECRRQLQDVDAECENLIKSREKLVERIEKEDGRYHELVEREKQLEARIDTCRSQLEFLRGLDEEREGYESGVKALLAHDGRGKLGAVADLVQIESKEATSVAERVMAQEIQTVVFDTDEALLGAMKFLQDQEAGCARLLSLERLSRKQAHPVEEAGEGTSLLRDAVDCEDSYKTVMDHLFGNVVICRSAREAMELSATSRNGTIYASPDGVTCLPNGSVIAGRSGESRPGILTRKQRLDSLPKEIETLGRQYREVVNDKENCIITRDEAKVALSEVNSRLSAGQRRRQEHETHILHYQNQMESVGEREGQVRRNLGDTSREIENLEQQVKEAEEHLTVLTNRGEELDEALARAKEAVASMEQQRAELAQNVTNAQLRIQGDEHKINQGTTDLENLSREVAQLGEKNKGGLDEKHRTTARIDELQLRIADARESLEELKKKREELQQEHAAIREEYNTLLAEIERIRTKVREDQRQSESLSGRLFSLRNEQTRAEEQMRSIREKIFEAYRIDLASPPDDLPVVEEEDREVENSIHMYKERLNRLSGEVNMAAPEEYEAKNKELEALTAQRDDLEKACNDVDRAIKKLNKEARAKFLETFEIVKGNFARMFTGLFEGGEAHLTLEEGVDPLEATIGINARPGGKKMRGVSLLSGGERAMTAISLLFALYMVKPSAYCILDELDAPLDDANIERFVRVVRDFCEQTQFIIVTHNKRTMEAADVLYGVTQQEAAVSAVVAVRLEEALRHAA